MNSKLQNKLPMLLVVAVVSILGIHYLTGSHAATPYAATTADQGTVTSGAVKQACAGSAGSNCVVFNGSTGTGGGSSPACTSTTRYTSTTTAAAAVAAAPAGTVICMAPGSYGSITLTGTHSGNVTLQPDPAQDPNGAGNVTFAGIHISGTFITVRNFYVTGGGIEVSSGGANDVIDHNAVGPTSGYGISILCSNGCSASDIIPNITISWNIIHDTSSTSEGDALRFDGWSNVTVTSNDIYNIKECASDTCHTDTLQSYNAGIFTSGLTITKNYVHDTNGAQGLPFLKDSDIGNVTISDNLSLRMAASQQTTGIDIHENTTGMVITRNTYQGTSGSALIAEGSTPNPSATVTNNVFDDFNLNPPLYTLTEGNNIFDGGNQWSFLGSTDTTAKPAFRCGSTCGVGAVGSAAQMANDDYELASNPKGQGIDWAPANQQYGPTN